jgi:uncharacterized protein YqjF (DUF2071 family)
VGTPVIEANPEPITATAPLLGGRTVASQRWSSVSFVHWRVPSSVVARLLPAGVRPDEHDGSSWVGLIAFRLDRATLLGSPSVPYFGDFIEVNVRLYAVDQRGRRGVVFRSLEASRLAAVGAARVAFSLPYVWSATSMREVDGAIEYRSRRHFGGAATTMLVKPGERITSDPLAAFLTARWALFQSRFGRTRYLRNEHEPWPLQAARLVSLGDELVAAAGLPGVADRPPDSVLFSQGVTTRFAVPRDRMPGSAPRG